MNPKRPPKRKGPCPLGGDHIPKGPATVKDGVITHTCRCGYSWSRPQRKAVAA